MGERNGHVSPPSLDRKHEERLLHGEEFSVRFWGSDVFSSSNIVFSNGDLDPWGSAGILNPNSANPSIIPVPVIGGAHHLDLRLDHPLDPPGVREARNKEVFAISNWIKQFRARQI